MEEDFNQRLRDIQEQKQSALCVGLDPDRGRIPAHLQGETTPAQAVLRFNRAIIDATRSFACAYKLNFAFYEALGRDGHRVLEETRQALPDDTVAIADAKRGDIGNSARFYAAAIFDKLDFDACTVSPYMGRDSITPFLDYPGTATFILARTSNAGAADLQERQCDGETIYRHVARLASSWNDETPGTAGLVAGATSVEALRSLRSECPTLPFLIPGVGAQGGDPAEVMAAAVTPDGPVLVNSSRSILYASEDEDFAEAAAREADRLRRLLNGEAAETI